MRRQSIFIGCLIILLSITLGSCAKNSDGDNTANAGKDQQVTSNLLVQLDASVSNAASNSDTLFAWTQVAGPGVKMLDNNSLLASFTSPIGDVEKQLTLYLPLLRQTDRLIVGETMSVGDTKTLPNGEFELRFQDDGNWCPNIKNHYKT